MLAIYIEQDPSHSSSPTEQEDPQIAAHVTARQAAYYAETLVATPSIEAQVCRTPFTLHLLFVSMNVDFTSTIMGPPPARSNAARGAAVQYLEDRAEEESHQCRANTALASLSSTTPKMKRKIRNHRAGRAVQKKKAKQAATTLTMALPFDASNPLGPTG